MAFSFFSNSRSTIRKLPILILLALLLSGCAGLIRTEQPSVEDWATLSMGEPVGQTFVAKYDGLSGVNFYLSPQTTGDGKIQLHLRSEPKAGTDLVESINLVSIDDIRASGFYTFLIPGQSSSNQKYYYAFLKVTGSGKVQVGRASGDTYLNGALYQNGKPEDAQAAFQLLYSRRKAIFGLCQDAISWGGFLAAGFFLFVLPGWGLFSLFWPGWGGLKWPEKLGLSIGLSLALYPLLLLWTDIIGLHLGAMYAWLPPLVGLGMILWRNRKRLKVQSLKNLNGFRLQWEDAAFIVVLILIFLMRFWAIRSLEAPQWADSVQHTVMAQLMLDNGGLFKSWLPYAPYNSLTVQFGFPAFSALFAWLVGLSSEKATLIVGQIINGLAVLALFPLAARISRGNRWAGVGAVLVGGLISPMPAYYVNWGRYAQLAGQAILPVSLWLIWEAISPTLTHSITGKTDRFSLGVLISFSALALAGMMLSYYRMPFYYATFILTLLIGWGLPKWHFNGRLWAHKFTILLIVAVLAGILFLPWGLRMIGSNLAEDVQASITTSTALDMVRTEFQAWIGISSYVPKAVMAVALIGMVWGLIRKNWMVPAMALWVLCLSAVIAGMLVHLPGANMMQTFAILIALYIPVGLVIGWLISDIAGLKKMQIHQGLLAFAITLLALYGSLGQRTISQPGIYTYVTRPDTLAMSWIKENISQDDRFFVEGVMYRGTSIIGSDAGWWLPLLAGRQNTMPPQYALLNEVPIKSDYSKRMIALVASLQTLSINSSQFVSMLCKEGISHVYIGQEQGRAALKFLGSPQLFSPNALLNSPVFNLQYHQDQVYIFGLNSRACP
jgi:hypothetical protein